MKIRTVLQDVARGLYKQSLSKFWQVICRTVRSLLSPHQNLHLITPSPFPGNKRNGCCRHTTMKWSTLRVPMLASLFGSSPPTPPLSSYCFLSKFTQNLLETLPPHGSHNIQHKSCSSPRALTFTIINTNWPKPEVSFFFPLIFLTDQFTGVFIRKS